MSRLDDLREELEYEEAQAAALDAVRVTRAAVRASVRPCDACGRPTQTPDQDTRDAARAAVDRLNDLRRARRERLAAQVDAQVTPDTIRVTADAPEVSS